MIFDAYVNVSEPITSLRGMAGRVSNMRPVFVAIQRLLYEGFRQNLASEGGDFDRRWPQLKPSTVHRKQTEGIDNGLLNAHGNLFAALEGGKGRAGRVNKASVRAGVSGRDLYYARFLQAGRSGGRGGTMAARPVVGIDRGTEAESILMIDRWIMRATP